MNLLAADRYVDLAQECSRGGAVAVPCNGCTLCCRGDAIVLKPDLGDRPEDYDCVPVTGGEVPPALLAYSGTEHPALRLRQVGGRCVYATASGCSLHGQTPGPPVVCREFDCRRLVKSFSKREIEHMVAIGAFNADVVARGRALNRRPEAWVR